MLGMGAKARTLANYANAQNQYVAESQAEITQSPQWAQQAAFNQMMAAQGAFGGSRFSTELGAPNTVLLLLPKPG